MHGQKKRRKRFKDGSIAIDGFRLYWKLISEPLWSTEHGYKGLCISVRTEDGRHRELILEYPFSQKPHGTFQFPQRPKFSEKTVETDVRRAMAAGWQPDSRGKTFTHHLSP
jgi:hypothetical protein